MSLATPMSWGSIPKKVTLVIIVITKGLCDTEDWRNDNENSALFTGINYI